MFEYLRDANHYDGGAMNGSITDLKMNINAYAEIGLGYSRPITDRLTVGGRVKVLLGIANAEMEVNKFEIDTNLPADYQNPSAWDAGKTYTAEYTSKAQITTTMKGGCLSYDDNEVIDGFDFDGGDYGISGAGFGIDLGATYKLFDHVTLSAAVLDLGFIKWNKSHTTVASVDKSEKINVNMDNYDQYISDDFLDFERFSLKDDEDAVKSRTKKLSSTILLAGEYAMFDNKLSVGAMYTARFVEPKTMNELTLSATYRPKNWLNAAVSYSPIQACGKSLGIALKLGPLFLGTDYMFFGNNSRSVNAFVGLSFPMGLSKKDACCKN